MEDRLSYDDNSKFINLKSKFDKLLGKIEDFERSNITYNKMINGNLIRDCKISYEGISLDKDELGEKQMKLEALNAKIAELKANAEL